MKNRKSPSRLLIAAGIPLLIMSILAGITSVFLLLNNLTLYSEIEATLQNLNKVLSGLSTNKPPSTSDLSNALQLFTNTLENFNTLQRNWVYTVIAGIIAIGFAVLGVFYSTWMMITFNTIKRDFNNLQEKYSLLLGSKRITDSELEAAKKQLTEQGFKSNRR